MRYVISTALAACCGFDLCYMYIWYLVFGIWYLYMLAFVHVCVLLV